MPASTSVPHPRAAFVTRISPFRARGWDSNTAHHAGPGPSKNLCAPSSRRFPWRESGRSEREGGIAIPHTTLDRAPALPGTPSAHLLGALFAAPLHRQPPQIRELDKPGHRIRGNHELMIEYFLAFHSIPLFGPVANKPQTRRERCRPQTPGSGRRSETSYTRLSNASRASAWAFFWCRRSTT